MGLLRTVRQSWRRPPGQDVSKSMLAFTVAVIAITILALVTWLPPLLGKDSGVQVIRPGLFEVAKEATGIATLTAETSVALYPSGLRVADRQGVLLDTVIKGSPLSGMRGSVSGTGGRRQENTSLVISNVRIDKLVTAPNVARYTGVVFDQTHSWPLTLDVVATERGADLVATIDGAEGMVWHLASDFNVTGYTPTLPPRGLRKRAWWLRNAAAETRAVFTSDRGADIGLAPPDVNRALDLRERGRIDIHIWSRQTTLHLIRRAPPIVTDSGA